MGYSVVTNHVVPCNEKIPSAPISSASEGLETDTTISTIKIVLSMVYLRYRVSRLETGPGLDPTLGPQAGERCVVIRSGSGETTLQRIRKPNFLITKLKYSEYRGEVKGYFKKILVILGS